MAALPGEGALTGNDGSSLPISSGKPAGLIEPYWMAQARKSMRGRADLLAASSARSSARIS